MKKRALLVATALIASSFAPITPALAQEVGDNDLIGLPGETAQEVCERALRPNVNSGFQTAPVIIEEDAVLDEETVRDAEPFLVEGTGDPTFNDFSNFRNYHRNGGSPNVWAEADANTATYPSSLLHYHNTIVQTLGTLFGCETWKDPGGVGHGPDAIYPPGLQTTGHSVVTGTNEINGDDTSEIGGPITEGGDFIDPNVLICISPNNTTKGKPGTWTNKHGFTGSCSEASTIANGTVPSGNAPE